MKPIQNEVVKEIKKFEHLLGYTIKAITIPADNEEVIFTLEDGRQFKLYHDQDCCENVCLEDVDNDWDVLLDAPLLMAEESTNENDPLDTNHGSWTWTFYKMATSKGHLTMRWYGTSNGYYSEAVDFIEVGHNKWDDDGND